jgi:hypothetical protein
MLPRAPRSVHRTSARLGAVSRITLDGSRDGLASFPPELTVVGRDDLGDVLAADAAGEVWAYEHGTGDWSRRSLAFATIALLHEHVAFQHHFELPPADADVRALVARERAIQQFAAGRKGAPYSRRAAHGALESLAPAIADQRFWSSKTGRGLAECQALGQRCEQALRDAGAPGQWIARAAAPDGSVLGVVGDYEPPWTEQRVAVLLEPLLGERRVKLLRRPPAARG